MKSESKIRDILNALNKNTMFRLSLTSKELFHSNFWAWLLEAYPASVQIFYNDSKNKKLENVFRENSHTDLSFTIDDKLVIIENKFKSFPEKEQLEKYANKSENLDQIILVSYYKPVFNKKEFNFKYKEMSYESLSDNLKNFINNENNLKNEDKIFIENYIQMIDLLNEIKTYLSLKNSDKTFNWFIEELNSNCDLAKKMNFQIFLKKIFFNNLLNDLLQEFNFNFSIKGVTCSDRTKDVNMTLMLNTEKEDKTFINTGIEISSNTKKTYRKYVNARKSNNQTREKLEEFINNSNNHSWFFKDCLSRKNGRFWGYDGSDEVWIYKISKNNDIKNMEYKDLKDTLNEDLKEIKEHYNL